MEKTGIVNFAMHVLGCGCDNSVFDSIEKEDHCILNCGVKLRKKIIIGKRLLIYIADADDIRPEDIKNVIGEGIAERNSMRYAIVTSRVSELAASYLSEFGCMPGKDDKTHIHIVSDEDAI
jgi:hypothetical protein